MNVVTSAALLTWSGISILHALFAPAPWPGLVFLAFSLAAWAICLRESKYRCRHFLPRTARRARRSLSLRDNPRFRF